MHRAELARRERGVGDGPGGQVAVVIDRSRSGVRNQDPRLVADLLPCLLSHYPELLGAVYVAPVNRLFYAVWAVVRVFLAEQTKQKFVLIRGKEWRERLAQAVGGDCEIPEHMRPGADLADPDP